jgi:hypothetical protein
MGKPNLSRVTVLCIDCTMHWYRGIHAIIASMDVCEFGGAIFFTDKSSEKIAPHIHGYPIKVQQIPTIASKGDYSLFCIKELYKYIETDFLLIVQYDGWVLRPDAWTEEFLKYDYIGAPWSFHETFKVGNGGFSLRSKRLMEFVSKLDGPYHPEDVAICRGAWNEKIHEAGMRIAPFDLAMKFSSESYPYNGQFGWHGGITPPG